MNHLELAVASLGAAIEATVLAQQAVGSDSLYKLSQAVQLMLEAKKAIASTVGKAK